MNPIDQFIDTLISRNSKVFTNYVVINKKSVIINDISYQKITATSYYGTLPLVTILFVCEYKEHFYQFDFTSLASNVGKAQEVFDNMIESVTFSKN